MFKRWGNLESKEKYENKIERIALAFEKIPSPDSWDKIGYSGLRWKRGTLDKGGIYFIIKCYFWKDFFVDNSSGEIDLVL